MRSAYGPSGGMPTPSASPSSCGVIPRNPPEHHHQSMFGAARMGLNCEYLFLFSFSRFCSKFWSKVHFSLFNYFIDLTINVNWFIVKKFPYKMLFYVRLRFSDCLSIRRKQVKRNLSDLSIHWIYHFYNILLQFDKHRSINLDFLPLDFPGPKNQKYYLRLEISPLL